MSATRRVFIQQSALAGAFTLAQPLEALAKRLSTDRALPRTLGYGPLVPGEGRDHRTDAAAAAGGIPLCELWLDWGSAF